MEPCTRKRCLPTIVTNRPEKRATITVALPLPTPEPQNGDVVFNEENDWSEALEAEIELRMKNMPNPLLLASVGETLSSNSQVVVTSGEDEEKCAETPEKEPEKPSDGLTAMAEEFSDISSEDGFSNDSEDEFSAINSEEDFSSFEEPEPYVPKTSTSSVTSRPYAAEPVTSQRSSPLKKPTTKAPPSFTSPVGMKYTPRRPTEYCSSYQRLHRDHCRHEKTAVGGKTCHWWVREVLPYDPNHAVIKVTKQLPLRSEETFMTEHIEYGSPYWREVIEAAGKGETTYHGHLHSFHDGAHISFIRYRGGKIKATRNHTGVIIRERLETPRPPKPANPVTYYVNESRVRPDKFPTEFIRLDSPYYTELVQDLFFPRDKDRWVHVKARDEVWVHIRLGLKGESLVINRNGVTVEFFSKS